MPNTRIKHRLTKVKEIKCKCGKWFISKTHNEKYCSEECRNNYAKNWGKIRKEFNDLNPHLCNICGCDNSGSRFKLCLDCREKHREYYKKYMEKKKNE